MKKSMPRRHEHFILLFVLMLSCISFSVCANSPAPARYFIVEVSDADLPEDSVYLDLLIKIDRDDRHYTAINDTVTEKYKLSKKCELVTYNKDGFVSFTAHFKDAMSEIKLYFQSENYISESKYADFGQSSEYRSATTQFEELMNYKTARIAIFDGGGKLLKVSSPFDISKPKSGYFTGYIHYDAFSNTAQISAYHSNYKTLFLPYLGYLDVLFGLSFSVGIELFIAYLLKFRKSALMKIAAVNILTQVIIRFLFAVSPMTYWLSVLLFEAGVYTVELIAYRFLIKEKPVLEILKYTVSANTASLVIGLLAGYYWYSL